MARQRWSAAATGAVKNRLALKKTRKAVVLEARLCQRQHKGLFGRRLVRTGNHVSFAENKTRRTWRPNVQRKRLRSELLAAEQQQQQQRQQQQQQERPNGDRIAADSASASGDDFDWYRGLPGHIRVPVTTHALRCIDRAGGLDAWLLQATRRSADAQNGRSATQARLRAAVVAAWERKHGVRWNARAARWAARRGVDYAAECRQKYGGAASGASGASAGAAATGPVAAPFRPGADMAGFLLGRGGAAAAPGGGCGAEAPRALLLEGDLDADLLD